MAAGHFAQPSLIHASANGRVVLGALSHRCCVAVRRQPHRKSWSAKHLAIRYPALGSSLKRIALRRFARSNAEHRNSESMHRNAHCGALGMDLRGSMEGYSAGASFKVLKKVRAKGM